MNLTKWCGSEHSRGLAAFSASFRRFAVVLSVVAAASCASPSSSTGGASSAGLDSFWSSADASVHDAQKSLRSAKQVAGQIGGEAAKGDYGQIVALGHRVGGLGHDHASPADNVPVVPMLDTMIVSIDALIHLASTSAELDEANGATDATVSKRSLRTQRLYHLLSAKKKVTGVRNRATAIGFRPAP